MRIISYTLLIAISLPLFAETKSFIREYTYIATEADSKITARAIALDQVKRMVLEEVGIYLQSEMQTTKEEKNGVYNELTKQQTQSITAGITETKIIEEKWDGKNYYIKASITVDPDEVTKHIARIVADKGKLKELEEVERKADEALSEIRQLRVELESTKSENEQLAKQKEYVVASNNLSATDWFQKGYNAAELKEDDNAILYFQKSIELDPTTSKAYYNLGILYDNKGNLDEAIRLYEKAIAVDPRNSKAYNNLGIACKAKGNLDKAIQLYEKAIDLSPQDPEAYNNLGTAYQNRGNLNKAIQFYRKAIEIDPQDAVAYYNLGRTYVDKRNFDKAIHLFEKAIKLNPQYSKAYLGLGTAYQAKGNLDKAIQFYQEAIELNPQLFEAHLGLGNSYRSKDEPDKAVLSYKKAIELNPQSSEAYWLLGCAYAAGNDNPDSMIESIRKAAQLGYKKAQQFLKKYGYTW
jgi:superkiller protein 3